MNFSKFVSFENLFVSLYFIKIVLTEEIYHLNLIDAAQFFC